MLGQILMHVMYVLEPEFHFEKEIFVIMTYQNLNMIGFFVPNIF